MINVISTEEILKRLGSVLGTTTDIELAKALGVASQTVSTWRNRNKIPYDKALEISTNKGVSLDWIIFGTESSQANAGVNAELMQYLSNAMNDDLSIKDRIYNDDFDLLCHAYNTASAAIGGEIDLSNPDTVRKANKAAIDTVKWYESLMAIAYKNADRKKPAKKDGVQQNFHGNVNQVAAGDINNGNKQGDK